MNAAVNDMGQFFAPAPTDLLDGLLGQYRAQRLQIDQIHAAMWDHGLGSVVSFFIAGNSDGRGYRYDPGARDLFRREGAIKALDAHYWDRALKMTDVLDLMPKKRRDEWFESIRSMTTPEFDDESVRSTMHDMLASRAQFFAERVDGIFRGLSREHITNRPEGFGKRMILRNVVNSYGLSGDDQDYINDLRCIIAKFMGRDEPGWDATRGAVEAARRQPGEWFRLDGGALKLRVYMKGTGHLEVHPDMAWRLNAVLASIHPAAIPAQFREPPKRKAKDVPVIDKPLPFAVVSALAGMKSGYRFQRNENQDKWRREFNRITVHNSLIFEQEHGKHTLAQAEAALFAIGAVKDDQDRLYRFDYPPSPVLDLIVTSGCIPDQKSHQFYPTPEALVRKAVELAEIGLDHQCLEPSAGTGCLVEMMPTARTVCVEISELHCKVLAAKGYHAECADFLRWRAGSFNRVVMNPPFDQGRWRAHLEHAASMLRDGGRLVAILPEGARRKADLLPGMCLQWHGPYENQFPSTSVSVVILVVTA